MDEKKSAMGTENLKQTLYDKMAVEQKEYRSWLLEQKPEDIILNAYEYVMRADLLLALGTMKLPAERAAAILASPTPLADAYQTWERADTHLLKDMQDVIEGWADQLLEARREAKQEQGRASDQPGQTAAKPSIKAQLAAAKAVQAEKPTVQQHQKDRGAR